MGNGIIKTCSSLRRGVYICPMNTAIPQTSQTISEATVSDYFALLKPKVMSLVIFTGFAGMWVAPGFDQTHPFLAAVAMLSLAIGAGAAGAINMWFDRDIDAIMNRTKDRPLPTGKMAPDEALTFGIVLSIFSVMMMGVALNWVAAGILAFANLFYVVIYTMWLKRSTPQNIFKRINTIELSENIIMETMIAYLFQQKILMLL